VSAPGKGERERRERGERERERERDRSGYEPVALHAPIHWAIYGYVIKNRELSNRVTGSALSNR